MPHRKAPTFDEYIEAQAKKVTASRLHALIELRATIRKKAGEAEGRGKPQLAGRAKILEVILNSAVSRLAQDPLPAALAEMAVAAGYLLSGMDCIPDSVAFLGLDDDDALVRRVFERQGEALRNYARKAGIARVDESLFG